MLINRRTVFNQIKEIESKIAMAKANQNNFSQGTDDFNLNLSFIATLESKKDILVKQLQDMVDQ